MMRMDRVVEVLVETYTRLKGQTGKSSKPILALLQELERSCTLTSRTKESIRTVLSEARQVSNNAAMSYERLSCRT